MHDFVYLAQRRSQEFSCEPNFRGGGVPAPWLRHCLPTLDPPLEDDLDLEQVAGR